MQTNFSMENYKIIDPDVLEEKKKLKSTFTIIYVGSIAALSFIYAALWFYNSPKIETAGELDQAKMENAFLLNEDLQLHEGLKNLDEMDINYSKLLTETTDSNTLNNLNILINTSEIAFGNLIDSMFIQKSLLKNPANAEKSDSILSAFISALNYRKSNSSLRMEYLDNNKNLQGNDNTIFQLQTVVQNKTDTINNLLNQLNFQSHLNNSFYPEQDIQPKTRNGSLQSMVKRQSDSIKILLSVYNSLIKDNSNLATQLKSNKVPTNNTDGDKINSLNQKIDDLYAELSLAKIDCNLTRANEKDIIYTPRQRKDLLQASLTSLKNLLGSTNPEIQRKVRDKLQLLQNISATVRN